MKATPLISSTFASAVVFLLMKFAVMAMASLPLNSLRRNPRGNYKRKRKPFKVRNQRAQTCDTINPKTKSKPNHLCAHVCFYVKLHTAQYKCNQMFCIMTM